MQDSAVEQHRTIVEEYMNGILDGSIPAGRLVRLAVRRQVEDLEKGHERGLRFNAWKAADACQFFPMCLRHSKGEWAGKPFDLLPFQAFGQWCVNGWEREDGTRRFTRVLWETARKSGKSELASGVALRHGSADDPLEPGAEVYLAATKEDQVRDTTFKQCTRMVKASPALSSRIKCQVKSLKVADDDPYQPNSIIKPIGSDSDTSDGFDLSAGILDELHAWQKRHHGFYERMTTAGGSRRQEIVWFLTTAGDEKSELWIKLRSQFVRALESVETGEIVADHLFAFIACVDDDDDPLFVERWKTVTEDGRQKKLKVAEPRDVFSDEFVEIMRKANPGYPVTPKPKYLRERATEAQNSPLEANKFMRFHSNVQVSATVRPFPSHRWGSLSKHELDLPPPVESYGAFDLGRSDDFAAWGITYERDGVTIVKGRSYTCADRPKELQTAEISRWVQQGDIEEHPGDQVDFAKVQQDIVAATEEFNVLQWAFDEFFAKIFAQQLQDQLGVNALAKFVQSPRHYNEACREFLKLFKRGELVPEFNPCTMWQANNLSFKPDGQDRWMPEKGIGREYKIDVMVAIIMAYGLSLLGEGSPPPAVNSYKVEIF